MQRNQLLHIPDSFLSINWLYS